MEILACSDNMNTFHGRRVEMNFVKKSSKKQSPRGLGQLISDMDKPVDPRRRKELDRQNKHTSTRVKPGRHFDNLANEIAGEEDKINSSQEFHKLRKRALKMYLTFGKDLKPVYPLIKNIAITIIKSGLVRKGRLNSLSRTIGVWAAKDNWEYYRELVKQRSLELCNSTRVKFQMAASAEVQRVMKTLDFTHEHLNQSVILDMVRDRSAIISKLLIDSIVVGNLSLRVFKTLAKETIDGERIGCKEKLPMAANEAHQFWTSAQKNLLNFLMPRSMGAGGAESGMGGGGEDGLALPNNIGNNGQHPFLITADAADRIMKGAIELQAAERKGGYHGNTISEAPRNEEFTKFNTEGCEDAFIVSQEGSDKTSKK